MADRAQLQIRILETLAAPVIAAACSAADPAQAVAEILGIAAQQAASAAPLLAVPPADADAARLALAAVAARALISQDDADGAKVGTALRAALDGMDALLPTAGRLESLDNGVAHDAVQLGLQRAAALAPVVAAIAAQPLGQDGAALAKAAADRINARTTAARQTLTPQLNGAEAAVADVTLFRAFAGLYAAVHTADAKKNGTADTVAASFEKQADMLLALSASLLPSGSSARAPAPAAASSVPPQAVTPPPSPAAPTAPPTAPPVAAGNGNPMSFFKPGAKKPPQDKGGAEGGGGDAA